MTETEKEKIANDFFCALSSPQGVTVVRDGKIFNTNNTVANKGTFITIEAALVHLYAAFHLSGMYKPEFSVINPSPSKPTGDYIFPHDFFLREEANKLANMDLVEFVHYGKKLAEKNVPIISVVFALDKQDSVRYTLHVHFSKDLCEVLNGKYLYAETVSGDSRKNNEGAYAMVAGKLDQALSEIPDQVLGEIFV